MLGQTRDGGVLEPQPSHVRLQAYLDRVWLHGAGADSPVVASLGRPPETHAIAEVYAVLPHPRLPRFLVPLESRSAAVASFGSYRSARARGSRLLRGALGVGYRSGIAQHAFRHRLVVSVDRRFPVDRWHEVLVLRHLSHVLDQPDLRALIAVRRINPWAKPTLQLFDDSGRPRGYAKLGTTPPTKTLVRTEAAAMQALHGKLGQVTVPALLDAGDWGDTAYSVGAPLPDDIRLWTKGVDATGDALREIAQSGRSTHHPLAGSTYAARLREQMDSIPATSDVAPLLERWLSHLERDSQSLQFGRMHGDWIPNNLGQLDNGVAVWDWEHSTDDAPVGFDLLHWHFHRALDQHNLAAAVAAVDEAQPRLQVLGVPRSAWPLVSSTYLVDMFLRWTKLTTGGLAWNPKWYPGLLEVARTRGGV